MRADKCHHRGQHHRRQQFHSKSKYHFAVRQWRSRNADSTKAGPATGKLHASGDGWPLCAVITNVLRFTDITGLIHTDSWTFNVQGPAPVVTCAANKTVACGTAWSSMRRRPRRLLHQSDDHRDGHGDQREL